MRLKRLISAFITCAMLVTFMPMQVFAAPKDIFNDTEFHIMSMDDMKQVVSNYYPEGTDIDIEKIYVHAGNKTAKGPANKYVSDDDFWWVENTFDVIKDTKVDGLTIVAKVDGASKEVNIGIDRVQLTHEVKNYITEIYLKVSLKYDFNGGTAEEVPQEIKYVEHDLVEFPDKDDLSRDSAVLLGFSKDKTEALVSSEEEAEKANIIEGEFRIDEDTTLYAVWAEDKNKNGKPDYSETKYTVTYDWGTNNIPEGVTLPEGEEDLLEGESYTVDGEYQKGTTVKVKQDNVVIGQYIFSGWMLNGIVVTGEQKIGTEDVKLEGQWNYTSLDSDFVHATALANGKIQLEIRDSNNEIVDPGEPTQTIDISRNQMNEYEKKDQKVYLKGVPDQGYGFVGWDGLQDWTTDPGDICLNNLSKEQEFNLFANFSKMVTVNFNEGDHGALVEGEPSTDSVLANSQKDFITFPKLKVDEDYKLVGWWNSADNTIYTSSINKVPESWNNATFIAQYEEINNPIDKIDVTIGENLAKEIPNLNKCDILHAEYGDQYILLSGGDGHFTTPLISEIWHSIPDSLTTAVDTVEEAKEFFNGFTAINTNIFNSWKKWLENDVILDIRVDGSTLYMTLDKKPTTKEITLNIYDIVNHKQVEEQTMAVAADAIHVNTGDINLPEGYEFTVTGDLPIRDNNVDVEVRPVETGKAIVNIRFMDGDEFVAGGDYPFEDGESVQFGDLELPEGYELDTEKNNEESGFVAKDGVQIIVHVKKAETDVIMNIRFVDEDTGEFVAGGDYFLPAGVQNYSILEEYVPDGYEMTVSGDFTVTADGELDVPVKKIAVEPGDVTMNIRFMYGDEFVAGGDYFIPEGVQNYSILEKYVPEGYRMAVSGDFMAVNGGKLDVPLEKIDAETVPVTIQYFHGKDLVKEVHREMTEGVHSYRELEKDVPEGYAMAVAGDFYAKKDAVIVVDLTKEEVAEYKVTVNGSYANHSGEGKYAPGEKVTIEAGIREDYSFDGWESNDDVDFEDADDSTTTFIMPAWDVTVRATWDRDSGGGAHHPDAGDDDDDNDRDDDTEEIIDEEVPLAETPWLNTEDHYAYIVGYSEDGTVRPNANITRAEVATIFFRLLTDNARDQFWMTSNNFSDVLPNDWYNSAVSTMVNMGIIQGYEDGTFRPNANITRAEFATIAARFLAAGYEVEDDLFVDIANHWARESINDAAMAGWINGYEDGSFRPDAAITRAEAVTMVNNVLGRKPDADHMLDTMMKWTDNMETSAWYYEAIQEATNSHDYDLFEDAEYETWTALQPNRDWAALEKDWANAHVA